MKLWVEEGKRGKIGVNILRIHNFLLKLDIQLKGDNVGIGDKGFISYLSSYLNFEIN